MILIFGFEVALLDFDDDKDGVLALVGLYCVIPLLLINVNERWFITMPLYLSLQVFVNYKE